MTQEPVAPTSKQRIVVVLGMHRSGTSLLTNLLKVLGVDLGTDLLPGDGANEMGYWENESIYRTQDALMNHIAKDWGQSGAVYPFAIEWERLPQYQTFQRQLVSIVRAEMAAAKGIWGFKDPRTCRLLPLWKPIFAELDLDPLYVLAVRDPADVAESMLKRSALDPLHTELVWLLHNLDALRDAGEELRIVVDYDRWFTAPCEQALAVATALDLAWPADDSGLVRQLTQTIRSDLRHSKARRTCSLPFVNKIYETLKQAAATGQAPGNLMSGGLQLASECLAAALELSSDSGKIALAVGHAEIHAGNNEAALEAYTRATRLQPRLASAHANRGLALQLLGRSTEALQSASQALSLDPSDLVALKVVARCNMNNNHLEAAENPCGLLLQQDPADAEAPQMIRERQIQKENAKRAADSLFGPRATKAVSPPHIVPAPIRARKASREEGMEPSVPKPAALESFGSRALDNNSSGRGQRSCANLEAPPRISNHLNNGHSSPASHALLRPVSEGDVCAEIGAGDEMFAGNRAHYFAVGESALHCIQAALATVKKPAHAIRTVLDLPCGHGRVMRYLKAALPQAHLTACDLNRGAVDFCARNFGADPVYSHNDLGLISAQGKFDLIWCGSLLTHLRAAPCAQLVRWFSSRLNPGALLLFTLHGRWVERSLATGRYKYGLPDERVNALLTDYGRSGFGYADYPGRTDYGISVCSPAYVLRELVSLPDLKLITYHEKGWDNHQDVVCLQKQGPAEPLG
jgi:SAM-dependent methyltransferase